MPPHSAVANASTRTPSRSSWATIAAIAPSIANTNVPARSRASSSAAWLTIGRGRRRIGPGRSCAQPGSAAAGRASAAELCGEIDKILGDHVEIVLGALVSRLVGAVLQWPADKGGVKAAPARRDEVAIMGRDHHALLRPQIEKSGGAIIGFGQRLVGAGHLGAEDRVPGQPAIFRHIDHQRDIAVGQGDENVFALQPGQPRDRIRPRVEPVPGAVQMVDLGLGEPRYAKFRQQFDQVLAVQIVEPRPGPLAVANLGHRRLITGPQPIGEIVPVLVVTLGPENGLRLRAMLSRQLTTVPNTSKVSALTSEIAIAQLPIARRSPVRSARRRVGVNHALACEPRLSPPLAPPGRRSIALPAAGDYSSAGQPRLKRCRRTNRISNSTGST